MESVRVRALGSEGQGIADLGSGKTLFVEGVLPGEEAEIDVVREKSKRAYGEVVRRLTDSDKRIAPPCPRFGECGGCSLMHMNEELQAEFKQNTVREALIRIGACIPRLSPTAPISEIMEPFSCISLGFLCCGIGFFASSLTIRNASCAIWRLISALSTLLMANSRLSSALLN